jgi:hypothetical protein
MMWNNCAKFIKGILHKSLKLYLREVFCEDARWTEVDQELVQGQDAGFKGTEPSGSAIRVLLIVPKKNSFGKICKETEN